ncbi:TolC family protein [Gemmatimonadota bacterium]
MSIAGSFSLVLALSHLSAPTFPPAYPAAQDSVFLTRQEARSLAMESGPRFLAAKAMGDAARGAAKTDRVYPFNPRAEIKGVEALDPGGYGDYEAVFSQEIEWAGQFLLRRAAGSSAMEAALQTERDALRGLLLEVDGAFFGLSATEERWKVAEEGAGLARTLREAVQTQYDAGQVSALELNLATVEGGRAEALALAAHNDLARARQRLRDLLGLSAGTQVGARPASEGQAPAVESLDPEALVEMALAQRPDVLAAIAQEGVAQRERQLASREAIPNLDIGAVLDRNASDSETTYGLRVSLPIPFWNRNQGVREAARAMEELRTIQRQDLELRVRGEVLTALDAFQTATEELELLSATVLEPTRENRVLLQRAYEAGQVDLPTTLLLQTHQLGAELAYWGTWLRQRMALAQLEASVGEGFPKPGVTERRQDQ